MSRLAIDLFCGLGGWTEGLLAEQWEVIGFDIERHHYWMPEAEPDSDGSKGTKPVEGRGWTAGTAITLGIEGATAKARTRLVKYPAQLVLQDVLTLHGRQFREASLIVASPPCQEYSYMAMPWSRGKAIAAALLGRGEFPDAYIGSRTVEQLNALFDACFRIQREACEAAGHHIPMVVENVRGAIPWVGRSRWNYGSFHLWGDVPTLMPITRRLALKGGASVAGTKNTGGSWFAIQAAKEQKPRNDPRYQNNPVSVPDHRRDGIKQPGITGTCANGKGDRWFQDGAVRSGSKSNARKAASAMIAKIPLPLARHIARVYKDA